MAIHMRNGIPYGGIPNGIVSGETPSTVPTTVKQLNQVGAVGKIAPVTIPSAVKFSNGDTLETAIGSVATIETSPAVAAHDAGEYIFYNGQMYKVIAAIAVGETLTVGTNISATNVGDELTALNNGLTPVNLSLTSSYTLTNTSFRMGKLIAISFKVAGLSGSSNIIAATIQQGYEPDIEVPLVANTNNGVYVTGWIRPGSGDVVIAPRSALSNAECRVLAVYHI